MEKLDSVLAILVQYLKGTVTMMINVEKVSDVDQILLFAWIQMDLTHPQIAVMMQMLELKIFAQLMNLVKSMKVTAIQMMNV